MSKNVLLAGLASVAAALGGVGDAAAHCDTLDGPVIGAARRALESGNANLALVWVQPGDDATVREALRLALADRAAGGAAREAADRRFFETLVRIHRAGEGAPYTGLKPAGTDVGPAVLAADRALESGSIEPVRAALAGAVEAGLARHFHEVLERSRYAPDDVAAGRAFVKAYVEYTHYAEGLHEKATATSVHHSGHAAHAEETGHAGHQGHEGHLPWLLVAALGLALLGETGVILHLKKQRGR